MLHRLRQARLLTRFLLVWFVLSLGAAVASPLVSPRVMELICSANGVMKVLVKQADGSSQESSAARAGVLHDCPLCATHNAPPPAAKVPVLSVQPLAHVLQPIPAPLHAARTAAPLMAHAPPAWS